MPFCIMSSCQLLSVAAKDVATSAEGISFRAALSLLCRLAQSVTIQLSCTVSETEILLLSLHRCKRVLFGPLNTSSDR